VSQRYKCDWCQKDHLDSSQIKAVSILISGNNNGYPTKYDGALRGDICTGCVTSFCKYIEDKGFLLDPDCVIYRDRVRESPNNE
jgi:hypothetical protein